ncbi:hypothetical protein EXN66_Car007996 [Channa argus]|uniref:Uncharacterized protein n=1 Tax=Channa argus TaxID=215402 RepID=A0A6G1PPT9_CHAAH|nr:hypothetical protein EXN66_Car007996 [Channa argus]
MVLRGLFGTSTGTHCNCVVFGEPLTAPVLLSSSRLGKVRQPLSLLNPPHYLLIKSTIHRAKHDNGGKVGRLHSLSQEEEVPWCTFTCVWCLAGAVATTRCTAGDETASMQDLKAMRLTCCVSCYCDSVE